MLFARIALALTALSSSAVLAAPVPVQHLPIRRIAPIKRDDATRSTSASDGLSSTTSDAATSATSSTAATTTTVATTTTTTVSSTSTATATATPTIPQGGDKLVVAHFMVGNAYSYTQDTWKKDIQMAQDANIDGFALNIGSDDWQPARVDDAYTAAQALGTDFKLFLSFDMTVLPGNSPSDAQTLKTYITKYYDHPNQLKHNGKSFASTFSGETSKFGHPTAAEGWKAEFVQPLSDSGNGVWFVPSLFVDPATIATEWVYSVNGIFSWNAGWPTDATSQNLGVIGQLAALGASIVQDLKNKIGSIVPDQPYISAVTQPQTSGMTYMASIAPHFFTHYGADTYNKNWLYVSDDHLYSSRWDTLIQNRDKVDFAEIITWNDYGESSYIGEIGADQPKSNAWVDGFDHTAYIPLTAYYAQAFKTGQFPVIQKDTIVLAARPHTKDAQASNDNVGKPTNWELVQDRFWADFLLTAPATVVLSTSDNQTTSFEASAGPARFSMPLTVGQSMSATVVRDGKTVLTCKADNFTFVDNPETYNFNSYVFGCTAP